MGIFRIPDRGALDGLARDARESAPLGAQVVLGGEEDGDEDLDDALGLGAVGGTGMWVVVGGGEVEAAGEDHAGEVADVGDHAGEVVAPVPEAVVGGLVAEDLGGWLLGLWFWGKEGGWCYEHETDDDGEAGDLVGVEVSVGSCEWKKGWSSGVGPYDAGG